MADVTVVRWRRYGKDRLYVNGPGEQRLGSCDLLSGTVTVEDEQHRDTVESAVAAWRVSPGTPAAPGTPPVAAAEPTAADAVPPVVADPGAGLPREVDPVPDRDLGPVEAAAPDVEWEDLATRRAGQEAREQAVALRRAAPVRTFLARVVGVHTDERAWRIGADGEEMVAAQLAKLVRRDPRWRVLHAVPVGENGSDIDHVVIGPPGVFTLNAKHHPGARIWVAGNGFAVNGRKQPYVRNSRHEARRAARLLTAATGIAVDVVGVVVPVGADDVVVKVAPDDVHVVTRRRLVRWLESRPPVLDDDVIEVLHAAARRSTTWRPAT